MKKIFLYSILFIIPALVITSCYKDTGNYSYHAINVVTIGNYDTVKGYIALYKDTLRISPAIISSEDVTDEDAYTYKWWYRKTTSVSTIDDSLLAKTKNLNVPVNIAPGTYTLMYEVTDKNTKVLVHVRATLTVTTEVFEGFMVLSDVNNQSRLDMLSYNKTNSLFTQFTDVLKKQNSTVPMNGIPYQVHCMPYVGTNITQQGYGIFLLNSAGTNRVNQETFAWDPTYNIRYLMAGDVPANFAAKRMTGLNVSGTNFLYYMIGQDNNVYCYSTQAGYAFRYSPLNVYTPSGIPFKVAPYIATNGSMAVMYNMDKKTFVTAAAASSNSVTDVAPALNYPTGLDLLYMECNYYVEAGVVPNTYAILKDPATQKIYLLNFVLTKAQTYYQEITGTDFNLATSYAVSPDHNYVFYSVGSKLYEYDMYLKTSFLMADYGASSISYLSFPHFSSRFNKPNYTSWSKSLLVGVVDAAGTAGSNGKLDQYSIPDVNGQLVKTNAWTGFGKIVSVGYRDR